MRIEKKKHTKSVVSDWAIWNNNILNCIGSMVRGKNMLMPEKHCLTGQIRTIEIVFAYLSAC